FVIILLVVSVLSAGNAFALEKLLKMQVFSVVASMGVGSYWVAMAFLAALILHLYTCRRFDRPMRALSRAMRQVTEGDFSVRVKPFHSENKFDYMDIMFEDFNRMAQELGSTETMKNDFIANVSHEIRTPLTVVNSYASALARGGLSEAEQRVCRDDCRQRKPEHDGFNILRLNKLENQEITPNAAPYDLTRQLCDCALAHEARWEAKHIDFDAQLEERVMVLADETMMEIVFNNLISNAIKFTEPGGRIVLRQMKDGDDVVVTVAGTGCGMDEATLAHIFDKFYQGDTSHSREGNGLGLALVRRVLEISGGAISVTSAPGEGSEFTVRLPRMAETA
ncbi:MAG: ATP-binding protein, partial [Christensenellales bacterium]